MQSVLTAIFDVFSEVLTWLITAIGSASTLFWNEQGLTIIGGITVIGVGIAVVLMVVALIRSLIRLQ